MSDELNDLIKKYGGGGKSPSKNDAPQFELKPVNETTRPEFNMKTEFFTKNKSEKSNEED